MELKEETEMSTLRQDADRIIQAAIAAALPDQAVKKALGGRSFDQGRVRLVAAGRWPAPPPSCWVSASRPAWW